MGPENFGQQFPGLTIWLLVMAFASIIGLLIYIWKDHNKQSKERKEALDDVLKGLKESIDGLKASMDLLGDKVFTEIGNLYSKTATLESSIAKLCSRCNERSNTCPGRNVELMAKLDRVLKQKDDKDNNKS